jgi:hypothetical protein
MNEEVKLTSYQWMEKLCKKLNVLYLVSSFDGWDKLNFSKSYYEEQITKEEFSSRLMSSTLTGNPKELMLALENL